MDKKKGILNIGVAIGFNIILTITSIIIKRFLIQTCGNEVNGLNSLYLSIIGFLSVAELGVGAAITFCLYRPIVDGDHKKICALYHLFNKIYITVGCVILVIGLALTPFLSFFAKDYRHLNVNMYSTFILMLVSVVITYIYGAKTALINAYKNNYITTAISSCGGLVQHVSQILILFFTGSFELYLACRILSAVLQGVATNYIVRKKYASSIAKKEKIDASTRVELVKSIKAMFMHKIGALFVNTLDSVIISAFVGVISLGFYSNYIMIMTLLTNIIALVFTSITSVLGHLYVKADKDITRRYCEFFHLLNFVIATVFYLGYYAIIDDLISLLFSADLVVEKSISFVIALNGFIQFMRKSVLTFRDATGTFYNDRWKPLFEGILNLILSICLVHWIGVQGVIIATIITNLCVCHVVEPYILYKNAFSLSPVGYYKKNYGMIVLFGISLKFLDLCMRTVDGYWKSLFINGFLSVGISILTCIVILSLYWKNFYNLLKQVWKIKKI